MSDLTFHKVSWTQLEKDCLLLAERIQNSSARIDKIVAISRGGLVTARILSDLLKIPISHITISSYQSLKQEKEPFIDETPSENFRGKSILLVDEIGDTGKTFKRATDYFKNFGLAHIYTLAPYIKSHTPVKPDFYTSVIDAWIIFPYEIRETTEAFKNMFKDKETIHKKLREVGFEEWEINL